jgi:hypothetical protein
MLVPVAVFARKLFYIKRGLAHDKVRGVVLLRGLLLLLLWTCCRCSSLLDLP